VGVILELHPAFAAHETGPRHPERPARLDAVLGGITSAHLDDAVTEVVPAPASLDDLVRVHPIEHLEAMERFCAAGGGYLDGDTHVGVHSFEAARVAAGAGLDAVARLDRGEGSAAFCVVRPPGHHARPRQAMGFCLVNSIAVTAAALADRGERVAIVDWDAHHGNGTQDAFYTDPRVFYASLHQSPFYPGTGAVDEVGAGAGVGSTINVPVPAGTTGDVYLAAIDDLIGPAIERFGATWVLISAGFDAHRADPLTQLGLTAGDYADLTQRVAGLVPEGRVVGFLEGGYDLDALAASAAAFVGGLVDEPFRPEAASSGGPGRSAVDAARRIHADR
jgi:acetoin utilization deacetylase AcuC-like enzyme